jgi:hypothetical protein
MRVAGLHQAAIDSMDTDYEIVQMNDAIVIACTIPPGEDDSRMHDAFFAKADRFFLLAAEVDQQVGGYGVRGVIASGNRLNLQANYGWASSGAPSGNPSLVSPRPIGMNTAFGRAYAVESSHKLPKVSCLYVESVLLLKSKGPQSWSQSREIECGGRFVEVRGDFRRRTSDP